MRPSDYIDELLPRVTSGEINKAEAVRLFRKKFDVGITYCLDIGLIGAIDKAILGLSSQEKTR